MDSNNKANNYSQLLKSVLAGEDVIISRAGKPLLRLISCQSISSSQDSVEIIDNQESDDILNLFYNLQDDIEVTLTRNGVPLAKVLPLSAEEVTPKAGLNRGSMVMKDDFDEELPDTFWGL